MAVDRRVTTQDVSWFLDLHRNGQISLNPPYQRRSVWSPKDRRFFLDTIFRDYPSPPIFLYKEVIDGKTIYSVVDGKQRLETIFSFAENRISIDRDYGDSRLNGKKWDTIRLDTTLTRSFWDYVLPVEFINVSEGTTFVNEVFDRLNRNSRKLVEQELRHAKYDGWFITFVERESKQPEWEKIGVVTTARAKRMSDVQFLSELLIVLLKGRIGGFDQDEINEHYAMYEDPFESVAQFDEDDVRTRFVEAKNYLTRLEQENSMVTKYARDFTNLYSLWAIIVLNSTKLLDPREFASKYSQFMEEINKFKDKEYLDRVIKQEETPAFSQSLKYYQNSTGARTEEPQRLERHSALISVLFEGHSS